MSDEADERTAAILAEGMSWMKHRYVGLLASDGAPGPVYTDAMRGGLLLLLERRLPGVPDEIEAWINQAEPEQLLAFVASLFEPGGLYRSCREILDEAQRS